MVMLNVNILKIIRDRLDNIDLHKINGAFDLQETKMVLTKEDDSLVEVILIKLISLFRSWTALLLIAVAYLSK